MMTREKTRDRLIYTPDSDGAPRRWWRHLVRPTEIVVAVAAIVTVFQLFGFRFLSPNNSLEAETTARIAADTSMRHDIDRNTHRIDSLSDRMLFLSYLQCVQATGRLDAKAQTECQLIIQKRLSP